MTTAAHIAEALAAPRRAQRLPDGSYLVPCPVSSHGKGHSDRHPSLQISDGASALLVHCHARCDPRDVLEALRQRGLLEDAPPRISQPDRDWVDARSALRRPRENDDLARIRRPRGIWQVAYDPRGTLTETYLTARKLTLETDIAGRVLRFHPRTPWRNEDTGRIDFIPCLIAAFTSIDDDVITAVHRIRLDQPQRWPKAERRMLGIVHRTAVMLDDDIGDELAIGEGIETCMAARMLGIGPVWALGSVGGIAHFPVLPGVNVLRIIGENDQASTDAVDLCGSRWQAAGRRVRVIKPPLGCKDLNDVLGAHAYDR
jgi:putative DNA primase/helicase